MDQNLPAMEQELLTHHVEKELCPECNRLLQELRAVDGMVSKHSGLSENEYWEKSAQSIDKRLAGVSETDVTALNRPPAKNASRRRLLATAASLVLFTFLGIHYSDIWKENGVAPPSDSPSFWQQEPIQVAPLPVISDSSQRKSSATNAPVERLPESVDLRSQEAKKNESLATATTTPTQQRPLWDQIDKYETRTDSHQISRVPRQQSAPTGTAENDPALSAEDRSFNNYSSGAEFEDIKLTLDEWRSIRDSLEELVSVEGEDSAAEEEPRANVMNKSAKQDRSPALPSASSSARPQNLMQKKESGPASSAEQLILTGRTLSFLEATLKIYELSPDSVERENALSTLQRYASNKDSIVSKQANSYLNRIEKK